MNPGDREAVAGSARQYSMLACALAHRPIEVIAGTPGEMAWTDGHTITIDPTVCPQGTVEAVVVQAALIGAASLAGNVIRPLLRHRRIRQRYLAIEGPRAVAELRHLLPRSLNHLIRDDIAVLSASPADSLNMARTRTRIPDCELNLGTLRPREVLAALRRQPPPPHAGDSDDQMGTGKDITPSPDSPAERFQPVPQTLAPDDASLFSAGSGSTLLGRLLRTLLRGAGVTGADGPIGGQHMLRRSAAGTSAGARVITGAGVNDAADSVKDTDVQYPEWDSRLGRYRDRWCTVRVIGPGEHAVNAIPVAELGLRRPLARLGTGPHTRHRQPYGDDIDIDAIIESRAGAGGAQRSDEHHYLATVRDRRDLAALILLDVSGSTDQPGVGRISVHDHQRALVAALATTMQRLGDRVAVYAFSSHGRREVRLHTVKTFAEHHEQVLLTRLQHLQPSGYSRLGAAIRHGARIIEREGATTRRLLIVVSDGLAFDHGYDLGYGAHDVRRALTEARGHGTGCLCLTVGATAPSEDLRLAFGTAAHASLPRPDQLAPVFARLARTALRNAEVPRRTYTPERTTI